MFADLLDKEIQPKEININVMPDIKLSKKLMEKIQSLLEEAEGNYVKVTDTTSVVKHDKNFVFFSNQWLYLAVLCKKYSEALKPYGDFFDQNIRGNQTIITALMNRDFDNEAILNILPEKKDRDMMIKFIMSDKEFRPGKSLLDARGARATKDVFGSCILKKIAVPDASSEYLGELVYFLSRNQQIFDELEDEINDEINKRKDLKKLSNTYKDCALEIVDYIYEIDGFSKITHLLDVTEKQIRIDISKTDGFLPNGNYLRYMFILPGSENYDNSARVFVNRDYEINTGNENLIGRLTTQWKGKTAISESEDGNNLNALIEIVNHYYGDIMHIISISGDRYIKKGCKNLEYSKLPKAFHNSFTGRVISSLLAKPFVILTGNSGTGKTRIARQFAEYMRVDIGNGINSLIVPVGADWTDNVKLLGFYNPLANDGKGEYSKTEVLSLIERANENPTIPFFLILDEMNLSHVERYFADFLSHMEIPNSKFVLEGYENELAFPDNLFVVGTVNIDETTYMFSSKVLDRANVIEFKPDKKSVLDLFGEESVEEDVMPALDGTAEAFLELAKKIRLDSNYSAIDMEKVKAVFNEVYDCVDKQGFEFAYRTVKEIKQYLLAVTRINRDISLEEMLDEQLLQKILPKVHGNRKEISELLDELEALCEKYSFVVSKKKVEQMKMKLSAVQYASFI